MKIKVGLFVIITLLITNTYIGATLFNNRNLIIGERAAAMGGAYTALSEDISGAYYNPAGLAFIKKPSLTMNSSIYSYNNHEFYEANSGVSKLEKLALLPTTYGVSFKLSKEFSVAFSIFQIDSFKFNSINIGSNFNNSININTADYLMGPSFSIKLTPTISVGVSVFLHFFQGELSVANDGPDPGNSAYRYSTSQWSQLSSSGLTTLWGLKWNVSKSLKIGATFGTETYNLDGSNSYFRSELSTVPLSTPVLVSGTGKGDVRLPQRASAGIAYIKKGSFTLAMDVIYYFKLEYAEPHPMIMPGEADYQHKEVDNLNISLGGEFYLSKIFNIRLGLFSNRSGATAQDANMKVDQYGASIGLGYVRKGLSSGFGIIASYGGNDTSSWKRRLNIGIMFGTTVTFGS